MNKSYFKLIVSTVLGTFIILSSFVMFKQNTKIDDLKDQLYLKNQYEQRATDYYSSSLNLKTIRTEFNDLQRYTILRGKISQSHTYEYSADSILGMKKEMILKGKGDIQYDIDVDLSKAIITVEGKTVTVSIRQPYLNEDSVCIAKDTLIMKEVKGNFISNKYDGAQAQKFFMESFVEGGIENIKELYSVESEQKYLKEIAEAEVKNLINTFNLNDITVIVKIIE